MSRLATGTGFGTRTLYSDGDETLFAAARPIVLNGIEEVATRPDLLDRALVLSLPTVAKSARLSETAFWKRFDAVRPSVLGALLTAAAAALARAGTVRMTRVPRMADFAQWVTAAAPALGWHPDQFLDAYAGNRQGAHQLALEASVIGPPLWPMMERSTEAWEGTATQLLEALAARTSEDVRKQREWPKTGGVQLSVGLDAARARDDRDAGPSASGRASDSTRTKPQTTVTTVTRGSRHP